MARYITSDSFSMVLPSLTFLFFIRYYKEMAVNFKTVFVTYVLLNWRFLLNLR